jgi:2-polyprenyl-6-methoxyphenol hydroxylase-like FAD-dependent oxidoreductase
MARICVLGGGVCGLATAIMLARDGHDITVLERDVDEAPLTADEAWNRWERKGVAQFRQTHALHARVRHVLAAELPDVLEAFRDAGAFRVDPVEHLTPFITDRSPREGDDRFWSVTGRRTTFEAVMAHAAANEPGVRIIRGERALRFVTGASVIPGVPHVTGVETEGAGVIAADLVIDAMGRQSRLPEWIAAAGGKRPYEEAEDCRFTYYTRFFASRNGGSVPQAVGPALAEYPTYSILALPADNGHWSVTLYTSDADQPMKELRHAKKWDAVVAAHPLHKQWLDGEALGEVAPIAGIMDRYRRFIVDGMPVVTGAVAVADAWACTNPSAGRGISTGLRHAVCLRDVVREHLNAPARLAEALDDVTEREVAPWYRLQVKIDRPRVAAIDAAREGRELPPTSDEELQLIRALGAAGPHDADAFRALMEIVSCLALPEQVFARPGMKQRILDLARDHEPMALPGPSRAELLALLN